MNSSLEQTGFEIEHPELVFAIRSASRKQLVNLNARLAEACANEYDLTALSIVRDSLALVQLDRVASPEQLDKLRSLSEEYLGKSWALEQANRAHGSGSVAEYTQLHRTGRAINAIRIAAGGLTAQSTIETINEADMAIASCDPVDIVRQVIRSER